MARGFCPDCSLLPDINVSKIFLSKVKGFTTQSSLIALRSWRCGGSWNNGRLQPIIFSVEWMICLSLVPGNGSSIPGGDGLSKGSAEVHHYLIWQIEFVQLPQKGHSLLWFFWWESCISEVMDVGARKKGRLHCMNWRFTHGDADGLGWTPSEGHNPLHRRWYT